MDRIVSLASTASGTSAHTGLRIPTNSRAVHIRSILYALSAGVDVHAPKGAQRMQGGTRLVSGAPEHSAKCQRTLTRHLQRFGGLTDTGSSCFLFGTNIQGNTTLPQAL
jgi:hypothetical protein